MPKQLQFTTKSFKFLYQFCIVYRLLNEVLVQILSLLKEEIFQT